ncbi:MAG: pilus assembly protein TadG-related protein [Armatimonadetes bacterium]|nr:pilus assembly protein TadG-related protein [Armatimonadota bacterium]MDW8027164.1 pilus assembly protein TadG-related protein [Armatimonadota bacterium]
MQGRKRGASTILTALAMFALLATAALAIDWGVIYFARSQLQNFVDASALAGAQELTNASAARQKAAETYARNYGENFRIAPPTPSTIPCPSNDPDLQPTTICYRIGDDTVHVTTPYQRVGDPSPSQNLINVKACRVASLFFARVLGVRQIRICAKATAIGSRPAIARGLVVLDPDGGRALFLEGNARMVVSNGAILVNSRASDALYAQGNASVSAYQISIVGNYRTQGNASVTPTPLTGQTPNPDPLASLPSPSTSGLPVFPGRTIGGNSSATLQPGVYTGPIRVEGNATVILQSGIYILRGGILVSGNGSVRGDGVLLYNESGRIEVQGNGILRLSPPTSGVYEGITIFQPATNTQPLWFSGNGNLDISGTIYAPNALVHFEGNSNLQDSMIVAFRLRLIGNARVNITAREPPAAGQGEIAIGLVE